MMFLPVLCETRALVVARLPLLRSERDRGDDVMHIRWRMYVACTGSGSTQIGLTSWCNRNTVLLILPKPFNFLFVCVRLRVKCKKLAI